MTFSKPACACHTSELYGTAAPRQQLIGRLHNTTEPTPNAGAWLCHSLDSLWRGSHHLTARCVMHLTHQCSAAHPGSLTSRTGTRTLSISRFNHCVLPSRSPRLSSCTPTQRGLVQRRAHRVPFLMAWTCHSSFVFFGEISSPHLAHARFYCPRLRNRWRTSHPAGDIPPAAKSCGQRPVAVGQWRAQPCALSTVVPVPVGR